MAKPPTIRVLARDIGLGRALAHQLNERGFAARPEAEMEPVVGDHDGVVIDVDGYDLDTILPTVRAARRGR